MTKVCEVVEITTPDKLLLDGLWFGSEKPKRAFIFVHGLSSTVFSHHEFLLPLIDQNTATLFFNNRGHNIVTGLHKIDKRKKKGYAWTAGGSAKELFTDCVNDIQGAINLANCRGAKNIYLIGHSTGSQKVTYFLSRRGKQGQVTGAVLMSPMSDYASTKFEYPTSNLAKAMSLAEKLVKENRPHELLPETIWPETKSAQRFLSLFTPTSIEQQMFPYFTPEKRSSALWSIRIPLLIILAGKDEHRDRPTKQIAKWFIKNSHQKTTKVIVIKKALHSFNGQEDKIAETIAAWLQQD